MYEKWREGYEKWREQNFFNVQTNRHRKRAKRRPTTPQMEGEEILIVIMRIHIM